VPSSEVLPQQRVVFAPDDETNGDSSDSLEVENPHEQVLGAGNPHFPGAKGISPSNDQALKDDELWKLDKVVKEIEENMKRERNELGKAIEEELARARDELGKVLEEADPDHQDSGQ
jgi:hypothetical protein